MWRRNAGIGACLVAILLIGQPERNVEAQSADNALLRVVNMSPDAPPVDLQLDGAPAATAVAFRAATPYTSQASGTRSLRVTAAGQPANTIATGSLPLLPGQALTLVVVGRVPEVGLLPLQDDNSPPPPNKARVRFVHVVPDAPQVDVAAQGGPVLFPDIGFRGISDYTTIDPGTYALDVRPAGTTTVAFTVPSLTVRPGQVVTVFASGLLSQNSIRAVPVEYLAGPGAQLPVAQLPVAMANAGTGGPLGADTALGAPAVAMAMSAIGALFAIATLIGHRRRLRR